MEVPGRVVIAGPNNAGKSNFFRMIGFFKDSLSGSSAPKEHKIAKGVRDPRLRLRIRLSKYEAGKIVDFFGFYDQPDNGGVGFVKYENRAKLETLLDELTVKVSWKKTPDSRITTRVKIEFVKIGLKMYEVRIGWIISDRFTSKPKNMYGQQAPIHELLSQLTDGATAKNKVAKFFQEHVAVTRRDISKGPGTIREPGETVLADLQSYMKIDRSSMSQEIKITRLIWAILERGIVHSPDSRHFDKPSVLTMVKSLAIPATGGPQLRDEDIRYNTTLRQRASSEFPVPVTALTSDGSNLSLFLLGLKTSPTYARRKRFRDIQQAFERVFKFEKLTFDVILRHIELGATLRKETLAVPVPVTVVVDEESKEEFPLADAGAGVSECIYLLALVLGSRDSVVLLDEPSLNMHPSLMREVLDNIHNMGENQIMVTTHSPAIVSFMAFENSAGIFYVRKSRSSSIIRALDGEALAELVGKTQLLHIIDPGIFFARCVVLVEGESDKNLLIGIWNGIGHETRWGLNYNDVAVVQVDGKENFPTYTKMLDAFDVPYMIVADNDARDLFEQVTTVSKETADLGDCPVLVIENGDLETLMKDVDPKAYNKASHNRRSKIAVAVGFAEAVRGSGDKTKPFKAMFAKAASLADGSGKSEQRPELSHNSP